MRVVSLVPSWTETLLACGVNVVGRSRFCVHPAGLVDSIPVVGGTKDLKEDALAALAPDLLLLDQEENLPWMANAAPVLCTHVRAADDMPGELDRLAEGLENEALALLADEWRQELSQPHYPRERVRDLPGVLEWLEAPEREPEQILYMIWRGPWMAVSRHTFIGSLFQHLGYGGRIPAFPEKYPKLDLGDFDPERTLLLFSSEPYPFAAKKQELLSLGFPAAIVDGELYSWFGVRSLRFLQGLRAEKG